MFNATSIYKQMILSILNWKLSSGSCICAYTIIDMQFCNSFSFHCGWRSKLFFFFSCYNVIEKNAQCQIWLINRFSIYIFDKSFEVVRPKLEVNQIKLPTHWKRMCVIFMTVGYDVTLRLNQILMSVYQTCIA